MVESQNIGIILEKEGRERQEVMKIKGKEYGSLTTNRGFAQFGVLKKEANFDLN